MKKTRAVFPIILVSIILLIDQISKYIIVKNIPVGKSVSVISNFFNLSTYYNTGAAYGMFNNHTSLIIIISLLVLAFLIIELIKSKESKMQMFSYCLIIGGLLGNLIDRIFLGYVRDFFHFILFSHDCAIFNVADSCIVIGAFLLIIIYTKEAIDEHKSRK